MTIVRVITLILLVHFGICAGEESTLPSTARGSTPEWRVGDLSDWLVDYAGFDPQALEQTWNTIQRAYQHTLTSDSKPRREDADQALMLLHRIKATRSYAEDMQAVLDQFTLPVAPTNLVPKALLRLDADESSRLWHFIISRRPAPPGANVYLPRIRPIFEEEGVPVELAWLAEVESAFRPEARSPAGAVGLFQLMPVTAQSLGLSTQFPDERQDVAMNTRAAAKYLHYLRDRFGDWRLALAAYNAGPTRTSRLLRESTSYSYEAIAGRLPLETQAYVSKVEATLLVREGRALSQLDSVPTTASN